MQHEILQWITEKKSQLNAISSEEFGADFKVSTTSNRRYGYNHLVEFYLGNFYSLNDRPVTQRTTEKITQLSNAVSGKIRKENSFCRIYFNDLDLFLNQFYPELWCRVQSVELLPPQLSNIDLHASDDIAASLIRVRLRKRTPKWQYRVNLRHGALSGTRRKKELYDSIKSQVDANTASTIADLDLIWHSSYFYCNNLDWLSAVFLIVPDLISSIDEYQTVQEVMDVEK